MNEEELVALGTDAEALLATEAFTRTINTMGHIDVQAFLASAPDEESKRTEAHGHYRALADIVNTLRQQVEVRDQINTKNTAETTTTEEE